ncbi:MAG: hypothetical protein QW596_00025 [Sulfolobales archaeon]
MRGMKHLLHTPLFKYLGILTSALLIILKANSIYLLALSILPDLVASNASEYRILALSSAISLT